MLNPRTHDMNSPEPLSPSPSTPSSGSPPPEETNLSSQSGASYFSNFASHVSTALGRGPSVVSSSLSLSSSSSSKRRLPGSSFATGPLDRDPKARKKTGDAGRNNNNNNNNNNSQYEIPREITLKKDKDELVDSGTVEWLRKEIGDPFVEPGVKF